MVIRSNRLFLIVLSITAFVNLLSTKLQAQVGTDTKALHQLFDNYYEGFLKLNPVEATYRGDSRYNDLLPNDGSEIYLKAKSDFHIKYQNALKQIKYESLDDEEKI